MVAKINLSFYKNLLYCDFFFIKQEFYLEKEKNNTFLPKFKSYNVGNMWELLKNFKRFLILIKFVLLKKKHKIALTINDVLNYKMTKYFFNLNSNRINHNILKLTNTIQVYSRPSYKLNPSMFYCLVEADTKKLLKNCYKIVDTDNFLLSVLNLSKNFMLQGFYNITTEFNEFKKILFFILFLNKVFNTYSFLKIKNNKSYS